MNYLFYGSYYKTINQYRSRKNKPKDKDFTLSDGQGLYLLIKPNSSRLWRFIISVNLAK